MTVFIANTNTIEIDQLQSAVDGEYIDDATVVVTVQDEAGTPVTGDTWPKTMNYVEGSQGKYRAALSHQIDFLNQNYYAFIEVDAGLNRIGHWEYKFRAQVRKVSETV